MNDVEKDNAARPVAVCVGLEQFTGYFWGPEERRQLSEMLDLHPEVLTAEELLRDPSLMAKIEFIFGAWGMPELTGEVLARMPRLKAVFYAGGSIRAFVSESFWKSRIVVSNSASLNAIPVAEYCLATILFSLKAGFAHVLKIKHLSRWHHQNAILMPGAYKSKVGLISLGAIGKKTLELLKPFQIDIMVYSTSLSPEKARSLGVTKASIAKIFAECDVVSLHTALLPETRGMIRGSHFRSMKEGATFINTARGAVVNQPEMITVLQERPDLFAVLDVVEPEPPEDGDPIFNLQNVAITPHISGSMQNECRRLGQNTIDECQRFLAGLPLQHQVEEEALAYMA